MEQRKTIVLKREVNSRIDTLNELKINKSVKFHLLECTVKDLDHISDLLLAKY